MADGGLTYFVSDVHLGLDVKDKAGREARFVAFLRSIDPERTGALYMLGDIWDFWYEYRDVVPKGYVRVFAALTALMDAGVKVCFIPGNHDIWCYSYFSELGMEVVEQPLLREIGGKTFLLAHGDGLGEGMRSYKLMRWAFHWKPFQRLFSLLHPWIAFRLGNGWSRSSRLARDIPYEFRGVDEPLYRYSLEMAGKTRIDHFIYGHYHCRVSATLPCGAGFTVLKDWMDTSPYAVYDGSSLRLCEYGG